MLRGLSLSVRFCLLAMFLSPAKPNEPIQMWFEGRLGWAQAPCIRWGRDLHGKGNFGGCPSIEKTLGVSATVPYATKNQYWRQRDCGNRVQCSTLVDVTREKSAPLQCGLSLNFLTNVYLSHSFGRGLSVCLSVCQTEWRAFGEWIEYGPEKFIKFRKRCRTYYGYFVLL